MDHQTDGAHLGIYRTRDPTEPREKCTTLTTTDSLLLRLDDQVPGGGDETSSGEAAGRRSASTHGEHEA
ncbi:hypothetical protein IGI04_005435 [Brassica rapa subsp. trilocularis]|uniref:Uncharacterized protein n=3 Tax=Brassica TaxID=3705 RepID=M4EG73_BRACM|nr:hypothetical protein IGI04_005435 [Brassica rapa subsp. trilocularis]CAF2085440.1 unnamed protein product [Brassica napus]